MGSSVRPGCSHCLHLHSKTLGRVLVFCDTEVNSSTKSYENGRKKYQEKHPRLLYTQPAQSIRLRLLFPSVLEPFATNTYALASLFAEQKSSRYINAYPSGTAYIAVTHPVGMPFRRASKVPWHLQSYLRTT